MLILLSIIIIFLFLGSVPFILRRGLISSLFLFMGGISNIYAVKRMFEEIMSLNLHESYSGLFSKSNTDILVATIVIFVFIMISHCTRQRQEVEEEKLAA